MSSVTLSKEASISPPQEVYARASGGVAESIQLPDEFIGQWITIQADTADIYINFSRVAGAAAIGAVSAAINPIIPAVFGVVRVVAGGEVNYNLFEMRAERTGDSIFLNHITGGAAGTIRFWRSSGPNRP